MAPWAVTWLTHTHPCYSEPLRVCVCTHTHISQIYFTYVLMHSHIQFHLYTLSSYSHTHRHSHKYTLWHPHTHSCSHTHIHTSPSHTCPHLPSQFSDIAGSGQREESAALSAWKNTVGLCCVSLRPAMVKHLGIWEASVSATFHPHYSQTRWCLGPVVTL